MSRGTTCTAERVEQSFSRNYVAQTGGGQKNERIRVILMRLRFRQNNTVVLKPVAPCVNRTHPSGSLVMMLCVKALTRRFNGSLTQSGPLKSYGEARM
jgi:hypothetical protein